MVTSIEKCTDRDKKWLFDLHSRTMKDYVETVYGWEDSVQWEYFNNDEKLSNYYFIIKDSKKAGAVNYIEDDVITINRIEILPEYQNQKIGTSVLRKIIYDAVAKDKEINLRVFKINPAKNLYKRLGFVETKQTETHTYMIHKKRTEIAEIDDFSIKPLSKETLNDFLHFFDNVPFHQHPDWAVCYCYSFHFVGTAEEWNNKEKNRSSVIGLIKNGVMKGYLAYSGSRPIGWCNANAKHGFKRLRLNKEIWDLQERKTCSVVCFLIDPGYRGLGIAKRLLNRVCIDYANLSYEIVEAYPHKGKTSNEDNCAGPLRLYEGLGFEIVKELDNLYIVQKRLKTES